MRRFARCCVPKSCREELEHAEAELREERSRGEEKDQELRSLRQVLEQAQASERECAASQAAFEEQHRQRSEETHAELELRLSEARSSHVEGEMVWALQRSQLHEGAHERVAEALEQARRSHRGELAETHGRHHRQLAVVSKEATASELRLREELAELQDALAAASRGRRSDGMYRRLRAQLDDVDRPLNESVTASLSPGGAVDEDTMRSLVHDSRGTLEAVRDVLGLRRHDAARHGSLYAGSLPASPLPDDDGPLHWATTPTAPHRAGGQGRGGFWSPSEVNDPARVTGHRRRSERAV